MYTVNENLDVYSILIPRFISYSKAYINTEYQYLDLYRIPKSRFTSYTKT